MYSRKIWSNDRVETYTITVVLPHTDPKQILVQATSLETINDIKQSLIDLPSTNQFSCFSLQYEGTILNDFAELSSLDSLPDAPEFRLVEAPYTERESRIHLGRLADFLSGNRSSGQEGETNFERLQVSEAEGLSLVDYDLAAEVKVEELILHDVPKVPKCLKSLSLSPWNPAPPETKRQGHLLYLNVVSLEAESIHITSTVAGYFANNSTSTKFDPRMRPGTKKFHSLLLLLKSLSPMFRSHYTELEKYMNGRDPILTVPVTNAHSAQPWIVKHVEHTPDPLRMQKCYLEQGFENNDSLRDWNEELQTTRELPVTPLPERIMRSRLLQKTLYDFSAAAAKGAELLVKGELVPLNPTEERDAQMYIYSNIFFSRGLDGVGTFIREGGDPAAHKAVALDVNGVRILSTLDVDGLSILGTCVVDFAGERIVAQSIVPGIFRQRPENESQIIYGGVDGRDIIATDSKCAELFSKVSAALRLQRHAVYEKLDDQRTELELSIETKGLAGADGRTYILDLYRLTPVDIEFLESECVAPNEEEFKSVAQSQTDRKNGDDTKYPHRMTMFRYELIEAYWEHKLNDYVQNKMAEEDAAASTVAALESAPTEPNAAEGEHPIENKVSATKEADTSIDSDDFTKVEANGEIAVNGAAEDNSEAAPPEDKKERRIDISGFKMLFNPDTFHARIPKDISAHDVTAKERDEALIRDVSNFLHQITIPKFVEDLKEARAASPMDSDSLSKAMHKRGINNRYMGEILKHAQVEEQTTKYSALIAVALRSIVSRSIKHVLSSMTRGVPFSLLSSVISHFFNCFFSEHTASAVVDPELETLFPGHLYFKKSTRESILASVKREAYRRFRYDLPDDYAVKLSAVPLLREVCLQFGIQLVARDYFGPISSALVTESLTNGSLDHAQSKKSKKSKKDEVPESKTERSQIFMPEDIYNILPVIKESTPRSGLAEEAMEAGRMSIVQGQKDLGMELLLESLSLHEQIYGVLHPEAARGYNALALIYSSLEDKPNAVELAKKAVVVAERTLGLDSAETILYYLNLALFEHANGNTKQALSYLQHALTLWRAIFGPNHPDMITTINNVAVMLQSQKLYPESLKWFESSVDICESVYGPQSVNAATLYFQIAQARALTGDHKSSISRMRDSYEIFKKEFGPDNHNTKETHMWVTQLTQNAVHLAKQAKIEATRKGRRIGGVSTLPAKVISQPTLQAQSSGAGVRHLTSTAASSAAAVAGGDERVGMKGLQSIDELVKYISGETTKDTATERKKKGKKERRPMH